MIIEKLQHYHIILASQSPRRHQLLHELGLKFTVVKTDVPEDFPADLTKHNIALYLASKKSDAIPLGDKKTILITADTIVCINDLVLNKPENFDDARDMLRILSGQRHDVITGVCIRMQDQKILFFENTAVYFKKLSDEEIEYYLKLYQPYDKAGAYGVQEWIGLIGLERIDGSYHNVMGLPVQTLYKKLQELHLD